MLTLYLKYEIERICKEKQKKKNSNVQLIITRKVKS